MSSNVTLCVDGSSDSIIELKIFTCGIEFVIICFKVLFSAHQVSHISCNMGTCGLPDMHPMLQLLHNDMLHSIILFVTHKLIRM